MLENLLVTLIVGLAAGYVVIRFCKNFKQDGVNVCGCSSCYMTDDAPCRQDKIKKQEENIH